MERQSDCSLIPTNIFSDSRMSLTARGVYVTLCALSEEERTFEGIKKFCPDSKYILKNALQELLDAGYIELSGGVYDVKARYRG